MNTIAFTTELKPLGGQLYVVVTGQYDKKVFVTHYTFDAFQPIRKEEIDKVEKMLKDNAIQEINSFRNKDEQVSLSDGTETDFGTKEEEANPQIEKLNSALYEIYEITKSFNNNGMCFYDDFEDCSNCDMRAGCNYLKKCKILEIIKQNMGVIK